MSARTTTRRGPTLTAEDLILLRARIDREGERRVAAAIGCTQFLVARACAGFALRAGSRALIRAYLDRISTAA